MYGEARLSRFILGLAVVAVLLAPAPAPRPAAAAIVAIEDAMSEMVLGKADAPVTLIEYSSLGCPHCAAFHRDTLPRIKKEYIDTGKLKLIFRDFPLGTPALAAAMIARCSGPRKFFGFIDILFRSQAQWSRSDTPLAALTEVSRFGGITKADVEACLKYQGLLQSIRKGAEAAQKKYQINSTPTFLIGGGMISGSQPFETFKEAIEKALNK